MKRLNVFLLLVIIIAILGVFAFFYYIKPQREYIDKLAQNCISKAMAQINDEVVKQSPSPYVTKNGFLSFLQTQTNKTQDCMDNYKTILFSDAERRLYRLDLNSKLDEQQKKIDAYTARVEASIAAGQAQQAEQLAKQQACLEKRAAYKATKANYDDCIDKESSKEPYNFNAYEDCMSKYNYSKLSFDAECMLMGISVYSD